MTPSVPPVRFAVNGGARIAYQCFGLAGDDVPTIVAVPPLAQNVEAAWERPEIAGMLRRFGSFARYVHFDKRGCGASDPSPGVADLDERVDDMVAVLDAAEVERAHLYGISDGGPMAVLLAATHPERVASVVLGSSAPTFLVPGQAVDQERRAVWDRFATVWGTEASITLEIFGPSLLADPGFRAWQPRYERQSASRAALRQLLAMNAAVDVRPLLPDLDVPVLQLHRRDDRAVPLSLARAFDALPDHRLVVLEGDGHLEFAGDTDAWVDEVEAFVVGRRPRRTGPVAVPSAPVEVAAPAARVRVLGGFAVVRDGTPVPLAEWGSRRARQLCKRLVLASGAPVTRDVLVDQLWPDEPDVFRLGPRLSVLLSTVRRVLGDGVEADRDAVRLDPGVVASDLADLLAARERGDDAAVVATWAGELLPEDVYADWTLAARDTARHAYLTAVTRLLDGGDMSDAAALALADDALWVDPHLEPAHRTRVRVLVAAGDLGAARSAYERYVAACAELDVDPAPWGEVAGSRPI